MPAPSAPHPILSAGALEEIYAHARREYPSECCGIVRGPRGQAIADQVTACENIQDRLHAENPARFIRTSRTAYNLDARDILALRESLGGDSPALIVYHSHVDAGSYFSEADQAVARFNGEPAYPVEYVVVDIRADGPRGATQFAWDTRQRKFLEVGAYVGPLVGTS